jgi:hypothetical protein
VKLNRRARKLLRRHGSLRVLARSGTVTASVTVKR